MNLPDDFVFSQASLADAADCMRRFQLRHIRRLRYPAIEADPALEYEARTRRGARFHKLVQQHLLGLEPDLLASTLRDDPILAGWWRVFTRDGLDGLPAQRRAELVLQAQLRGRRLLAKYDLLALEPGGDAIIVDWKTGTRQSRDRLEERMQTILYRYVLAVAGGHLYGGRIPPERVKMVYRFIGDGGGRVELGYSTSRFEADEARLLGLIERLEQAREFPLTEDKWRCGYCTYRSLCERGDAASVAGLDSLDEDAELADEELALDFDQIAEVEF